MLIPIFVWSIIPFTLNLPSLFEKSLSFLVIVRNYIGISVHNLWFLWAVYLLSFIIMIIRVFCKDNIILYLALWVLSNFINDKYNMFLYAYMYPFFVLGYLYNTKDWKKIEIKGSQFYCAIIFVGMAFLLLLNFFSYDKYIYISKFCVFGKESIYYQLYINLYRFIIGIAGSIFFMLVLFKIYQYKKNCLNFEAFYNIGRNSIGIYIISVSVINPILFFISRKLIGFNIFYCLLESFIVLSLSYLFSVAIKKMKKLNIFLFGGRV